jgi:hypothetical protein
MVRQPGAITYFRTPVDPRRGFRANHATAEELWAGFYDLCAKGKRLR